MVYGLELLEYYNPKHWVILNNEVGIEDDVITWGIPHKNINFMRGGELIHIRVWNNIFSCEPKPNKIYITPKLLIIEILGYIYSNPKPKTQT